MSASLHASSERASEQLYPGYHNIVRYVDKHHV